MATLQQRDASVSPELTPRSLETHPPSPAPVLATARPSAHSTASVRVKAPTRTYGKKFSTVEEGAGETEKREGKQLERQSTVIIPETDPDVDIDGAEDTFANGRKGAIASNSSSPPNSELRSTSPTSTEGDIADEEERTTTKDLLRNLSDESSDEEEEDQGNGAIGFFEKHGNLEDKLRAIDAEMDAQEEDTPARPVKATTLAPPTSSSLPTLTDSDAVSREHSSSQPTPSARQSSGIRILNQTDDDESQDVFAPTARSKKAKARIVDSDDEEPEDEAKEPRQASVAPRRSTISNSSDHEGDVGSSSPVPSGPSVPAPSRAERVAELAAKKRATLPPTVSPPRKQREDPSSAIENASSEEEPANRKKRTKKPAAKLRVKRLSKKAEDEMHKQTATFAREQQARLEPVTKGRISVVDTLNNARSHRQNSLAPVRSHTPHLRAENVLVLTSSDDPIVNSSSPKVQIAAQPSAKALGKQRERSPIEFDLDATPQARRTLAPPLPWGKKKAQASVKESKSDDEEDLESIEQYEARRAKEKRDKQEAERVQLEKRKEREAVLKAARAAADSDSDIEIEGQPMLPPRPPKPTRRTSADRACTPRPGTQLHHVVRDLAHVVPSHHEDPTDSQMHNAGRDFGRNLEPAHHYAPPAKTKAKSAPNSRARQPVAITQGDLNHNILEKSRLQAIASRQEKMVASRRQQVDPTAATNGEPARIDVSSMFEKKKAKQAAQQEEDDLIEEADDPDYQGGTDQEEEGEAEMSGEEGEDAGSGSDVPEPVKGARREEVDLEEGEFDSDGELKMPVSSQNSDRLGGRDVAQSQDDDDDDDEIPIARKAGKPRRVIDDEEEEENDNDGTSTKTAEPTIPSAVVVPAIEEPAAGVRMDLDVFGGGGDDGGGFSQFFNSQFSQEVAGENQAEGFARPADPTPFGNVAPTMFAAEPLISTAERAADAALLEARGGIHNLNPGTPREAAIPRQYINTQGFMTQTRPVGLFADSPSFSPRDSQQFQESLSTAQDSQSQRFTQTQIDATPTQAAKHANQLRRQHALVRNDSLSESLPDPTEVVEEEESFPSAAQAPTAAGNAPRDAFAALRQGAALASIPEKAPPVKTKRREFNPAYLDDQAGLDSDEEQPGGLNAASGDEDETGHDEELEELVDNEVIAEELQAEQDSRAGELHREELDKREAAALKRAQNIADGKERNKRKAYELDDEDFDDEFTRRENREKLARIDNMNTVELLANEKTRAFAEQLRTTCIPISRQGDTDMFEATQNSQLENDEDPDLYDEESQDFFGGHEVKTKTTYTDVRLEAIQRQRELEEARFNQEEIESQIEIHLGNSSSPVAQFKTNNRILAAATKSSANLLQPRKDNYEDIESQYSVGRTNSISSLVNYKTGDSREDSQGGGGGGNGNGVSAGGRSAVTSFKKGSVSSGSNSSSSTTSTTSSSRKNGGSSSTSASSRTALGPKSSKFSAIRKSGFAP